ncbi:MAG: HAD-IIIA family hydrolase [Clostridia bacterium]|nr:HAD-IIIA family hydrolase [Clostridia bacterium]
MKAVIMAGGRGTRLASVAKDVPKPMVSVGGMPVLEYEIAMLREQGFDDILLTVGHMGGVIMDYFGDGSRVSPVTGRPFGAHIEYYVETEPLGSAGALMEIRDRLTDDFLLLNGDVVFHVDFGRMIAFHREKRADVTLFVHPNSHPYDSGLLVEDERGAVARWLTREEPRPEWYHNTVNAGLHILNASVIDEAIRARRARREGRAKADLDRDILKPLAGTGRMFCYHSPEYVKDMGTPERLAAVRRDFAEGRVQNGSLREKRKAVFLDRDGTINEYVGFLRRPEDFRLLPGAAEAVKLIHEKGYLAVVATNQPVIARGEVTLEGLDEIHRKMETLLGLEGAFIDALYFCPHHPDGGFAGERPEYKIACECRKPKPGMLLRAAKELNIDLAASWMAGDGKNDIGAGKNAGCRTALIGTEPLGQDVSAASLLEFARDLLPSARS